MQYLFTHHIYNILEAQMNCESLQYEELYIHIFTYADKDLGSNVPA